MTLMWAVRMIARRRLCLRWRMNMVGHRYIVKLRIENKRWYPGQGETEKDAHEWTSEKRYDMVCPDRGLPTCHRMVESLLGEDFGVRGIHDGCGIVWSYVIDEVEYKGEVRLLDGDGR